jgi:hypothetical protein
MNYAMKLIRRTRCVVLGAVAIACSSISPCVLSAEEAHPLEDALLDPAGVLRPAPVDDEPEHPLRKYVGDPFRFDFETPQEDTSEIQNREPQSEQDPYQRSATEWDALTVGELPTQEGAIIYGDPAVLMAESAMPTEPELASPSPRFASWLQIAVATAVILSAGALCWCRYRWRSHGTAC